MVVEMKSGNMNSKALIGSIIDNVANVIRGKRDVIEMAMVALLSSGHLLLEDIPGVGKTLLALSLARSIDCPYRRIQFTNDTIPADIIGMMVYSRNEEKFRFVPGPIFAGVVLADEINRTSPKTQSALLEAMSEKRISIENRVFLLPEPFLVIATQNPVESHGAFPLPESQLDRFLLRLHMGYPDQPSEKQILEENLGPRTAQTLSPVVNKQQIVELRAEVDRVKVDDSLLDYILSLAQRTRNDQRLALGASPRGALMLKQAAQALAIIGGRDFVLPDDIKRLLIPVWTHRIQTADGALGPRARREEAEFILTEFLETEPVPQ